MAKPHPHFKFYFLNKTVKTYEWTITVLVNSFGIDIIQDNILDNIWEIELRELKEKETNNQHIHHKFSTFFNASKNLGQNQSIIFRPVDNKGNDSPGM